MLDNPDPNIPVEGSEKPELAIAAQIGVYFHQEMEKLEEKLGARISEAVNLNAKTVGRMNELEGAFGELKRDLLHTRQDRADKEVREAEARYKIALEHKDNLSTQERIEVGQVVEDKLSAAQRARAEKWRAFWDKITPSIATAMILAVIIPVWLAFVILILAFVLRALGIEVQLP